MSAALLVLLACCCSSSSVGAYFALNKTAKYYEVEIDTRIDKVIENGADPKDCKDLYDFVTDNIKDIEKKEVNIPVKGTQKGDILDTILRWDTLTSVDTDMGRTKQEKLATLCDSKKGTDLVSELVTKVKNEDTSFCGYIVTDKSVPSFVWDEETENFIEVSKHLENEIKNNELDSKFKGLCDNIGPSP